MFNFLKENKKLIPILLASLSLHGCTTNSIDGTTKKVDNIVTGLDKITGECYIQSDNYITAKVNHDYAKWRILKISEKIKKIIIEHKIDTDSEGSKKETEELLDISLNEKEKEDFRMLNNTNYLQVLSEIMNKKEIAFDECMEE